ncbi:MAG: hypothetical protein HDR14_06650 [Lachnospiraceae bacterium]|nr:hypothetical protein [Lachnospiraceae bacterium]
MKKSIKTCCCLGLTLLLALSGAREVNAADGHCGTIKVSCGNKVADVAIEPHQVYVNGNIVACQRTKEMHLHTISCTGCKTVLKSNVVGTCIIKHTICPTETGDCQSLR